MKRVAWILYLVLYVALIVSSVSDSISNGYPYWFSALMIVCRASAATMILMHLVHRKPSRFFSLWKGLPFVVVAFDVFHCSYEYAHPEGNGDLPLCTPVILGVFVVPILTAVVFLLPAYYCCFKVAHSTQHNQAAVR